MTSFLVISITRLVDTNAITMESIIKRRGYRTVYTTGVSIHCVAVLKFSCLLIKSTIGGEYW